MFGCVASIFVVVVEYERVTQGKYDVRKYFRKIIISKHMCSIYIYTYMNRCKKYASIYMHEHSVVSRQT